MENQPSTPEEVVNFGAREKPRNVVEIDTNDAKYSIVYSTHTIASDSEAVTDANGIILELTGNYQTQELAQSQLEFISKPNFTYNRIIKFAAEKGKPIFLVDLSADTGRKHAAADFLKTSLVPVVETMVALGFVLSEVKNLIKPKQNISRRGFLRKGSKAAVGAYLLSPQLEIFLNNLATGGYSSVPEEGSNYRKAERLTRKFNKIAHPELHSVVDHVRNDLIAQKSEAIARMMIEDSGERPNLSLLIGSRHTGIEDSFESNPDERVERLRKELGDDLVEERFIVRIDFEPQDGNEPKKYSISILEDPSLSQ